ncbi:unnamed protein product [Lactuca saligna]|uniref:Uncharacterized protein n=1 Tax=Lactuca saligna TaxID=75948 RepID=A0AA35Z3P1_LACSI|nr:unnamed protein product [Lactuca saligna]
MSTVGRWIHMAVTRNVKQLQLMFSPEEENEDVEMPNCLVTGSSLEVLRLNLRFRCLPVSNTMGFPALRVLHLTYVDFLGDCDLRFDGLEEWELHEGDVRRKMTPDVKRVEFFEFKGEKPKLDLDWHEVTFMEMRFDGPEEWELHEGDVRRKMTPDVKRVEFFEFKGENPKLDLDWHEVTFMEMVFSWGTKAKYFL